MMLPVSRAIYKKYRSQLSCTMLEDEEIDAKCEGHNNCELLVIECMAEMANYLESKVVPEI